MAFVDDPIFAEFRAEKQTFPRGDLEMDGKL